MRKQFNLQLFAAPTNTTVTTDLEPGISIDYTSRISSNINELQDLLGVTELTPMSSGTTIKIYKMEIGTVAPQVGEGETIGLTKVARKKVKDIDLVLEKYRKSTTAEAIQRSGRNIAINQTDEKMVGVIQGQIKKTFYSTLKEGTGTATGKTLQSALSAVWGELVKHYKDETVTPIYFVSTDDIAEYLGSKEITLQTAYGFTYLKNFLGLGDVIVSPELEKGTVYGTAKENIAGAYIPTNNGDVADTFGLTSDTTGLVGMVHTSKTDNATIETLLMCGVKFFVEYVDGVFKGTITPGDAA